jgi:hypothetical protein
MDIFAKHSFISSIAKEGKVFFRRRLKNGVYIKFHASQRTELQTTYILDSKLYISNITDLVQQMLH